MEQKKHWQSFGELKQSDAYNKDVKDEFREDLPFVEDEGKNFLDAKAPRRDFLKYLGFSTAAAAVAASCEMPVKKAIPFANKPEDVVPGNAKFYATTYVNDGDVVSVLAKVRDGRPIKIEGNELSPITGGGTSARVQASVLDLYDTARLRFPTIDGKEVTYEAIDKSIAGAIAGPVVLLTSTITSPTTKEIITAFLAKYPGGRHVVYDAVSCSGMLLANEASYGKRALPSYHFENAKAIVSIGADFLGTWLSPVEFNRQYATGRKLDEKNPAMSKHIHFDSIATLTGSNADERYLHRPSETGSVVAALLAAVQGQAVTVADAKLKAGIEKAARELNANKGAALVVCGSNDVNVQIVVNAINAAIGANGTTIDFGTVSNCRQGIDADFVKLVDDMNAGAVGTLLIHGANPAYTWYDAEKFKAGLKKVRTTISFNGKMDETTELCKYAVPDHHYLESWGDAEAKTGHFSFLQPTIFPLFKTRQWQDSLLKWSGATGDYLAYLKNYWGAKVGGESGWDKALQDGVINPATAPALSGASGATANLPAALAGIGGAAKRSGTELVIYEKVSIGANGAANPWLQEMPDPVTRATWDNYVVVSPDMARSLLGIDLNKNGEADDYEVNPPKKVVRVTVNGKTIELPTLIIPNTHPNVIGIALGYGRSAKVGKAADGFGKNAFPLLSLNGTTISFINTDVKIEATGDTYPIALTQTHSRYDTTQGNRTEVVKELTLAEFKAKPNEIREDREKELKPWGGLEKYQSQGTLYPVYDRPGIKWGMAIDMNSCTGCGACVVACTAENNVPVVGKPEVLRGHEMQWMRIDRYFSGDMDNPNVTFEPMLCQHCDNAPCENVCPVAATNHSSEGINQMAYNRCIGTRYCANNCPFKVRRFNWADYTGADSFPDNQGHLNDVVHNMNDDLTRMVLNPDVTVRSRGVIEKCSFCVQRTQEAKLKAKRDSRPLVDSDIKVACQQACPTNAITFGNANDKNSAITKLRMENPNRQFYVLEQLHVLPNITYLAKVRNRDEEAVGEKKEHA
ncbi:MAG: TAT-variant-translocated molybdopterin oxidoreductase [Chitinophagaceae bacterium]|nr:TAT-variant-translocated molybdopterin oxidoreductase [Chitinophagaceae bacterium]